MAGRRGARSGRGWDAAPPPAGGFPRRGRRRTGGARSDRDDPPRTEGQQAEERQRAEEQRDPAELAREICLRQLAVRPRTRAELATALRRRGIDGEVAESVLDRYDEVGIIDDAAFATAWVASRHHGKGLARRALAGELRQRGVDPELVGEALDQLDPDTEAATARALVERKLRGVGRATPEAVFRRLVGALARKGYPPGLAVRVVKEALAAQSDEAAEFADGLDEDALTDALDDADARPPAHE